SEAPSYASSNQKNRNKRTKRKLSRRKIDGIIYLIEELHEIGVIEGARALNYDDNKTTKIQVFGIIHLGLRVQFSRLWRAEGSITIFKKDLPLYELPHNFSIDKFKHILKFLVSIYQYKTILKNNIQVLREEEDPEEDLEEDQKEQNILNELLNVGQQQVPPSNSNVNYFADCFRTPKKPRQKKGE
ncbi:636_t:CDS:2, partial [Funneliformis mosseae]